MKELTLVVMAAGMGSRYGGLKQLDGVGPGEQVMLEYSLYDAIRAGFSKVVFIIRSDIREAFEHTLVSRFWNAVPFEYAFQEIGSVPGTFEIPEERTKPWGTGHAVLCTKDLVKTPFAVINADDYYGPQAYKVLADALRSNTDEQQYHLVSYALEKTLSEHGSVSRGVCEVDAAGYLKSVAELTAIEKKEEAIVFAVDGLEKKLSGQEPVSLNLWGFTPGFFDYLEAGFTAFLNERGEEPKSEFYLPACANECVKKGQAKVKVIPTTEQWFGVTYQEDKPMVAAELSHRHKEGFYPDDLWG